MYSFVCYFLVNEVLTVLFYLFFVAGRSCDEKSCYSQGFCQALAADEVGRCSREGDSLVVNLPAR